MKDSITIYVTESFLLKCVSFAVQKHTVQRNILMVILTIVDVFHFFIDENVKMMSSVFFYERTVLGMTELLK